MELGTSMLCDEVLLRSAPAMSASRAKSVSWSIRRADLRDSSRRTSSRRLTRVNGAPRWGQKHTFFCNNLACYSAKMIMVSSQCGLALRKISHFYFSMRTKCWKEVKCAVCDKRTFCTCKRCVYGNSAERMGQIFIYSQGSVCVSNICCCWLTAGRAPLYLMPPRVEQILMTSLYSRA